MSKKRTIADEDIDVDAAADEGNADYLSDEVLAQALQEEE